MPATTAQKAEGPGAQAFSQWLAACGASPWSPLTPEAAEPYRYIWASWLALLDQHGAPWSSPDPRLAKTFIDAACAPGKDRPSEITRRRYWRVLDRVYEFAILHGLAEVNPAQEIAAAERPAAEDPQGAILTPRMLHAARSHIRPATTPVAARDNAILLCLLDAGPTPAEIQSARVCDFKPGTLHFPGFKPHQRRDIALSAEATEAMATWLRMRDLFGPSGLSDALFVARNEPHLSAQALQRVTRQHLLYAAHHAGLPEPMKLGPQVFRNTAIVGWIHEGRSIHEVLLMAGVKSPSALDHLRAHLPANVRLAISASSPSESIG